MSRSYRKPFATDGYGTKSRKKSKQQANRAVRVSEDVPSGMAFKKFFCSWNIRDYTFYSPNGDWLRNNPWKYRRK